MGVAAGTLLLKNNSKTDGIIIGTANGGLEDCIKFLAQIVDYNEGTLTPTNFVQSTPNSVAGQLALADQNTGYNVTHVHAGLSFENALEDAALLFDQEEAETLLVGGLEEISDYNHQIDRRSGFFKTEATTSLTLIGSGTPGTVCGEGAVMFLLEKTPSLPQQVRILAVDQLSFVTESDVLAHFPRFLLNPGLNIDQVDGLILGYNGDAASDGLYREVASLFHPETPVFSFKNACGEYPTASAFAIWLGQQLLLGKNIPEGLVRSGNTEKRPRTLLIYNHFMQNQHAFILLQRIDR